MPIWEIDDAPEETPEQPEPLQCLDCGFGFLSIFEDSACPRCGSDNVKAERDGESD